MARKFQNIAFGYAIHSYSHNIESTLHICVHVYYIVSFRYAKDVVVGDEILVHEASGMIPAKVFEVISSKMQGMCQTFIMHVYFLRFC